MISKRKAHGAVMCCHRRHAHTLLLMHSVLSLEACNIATSKNIASKLADTKLYPHVVRVGHMSSVLTNVMLHVSSIIYIHQNTCTHILNSRCLQLLLLHRQL